jgi:hypothetical protein
MGNFKENLSNQTAWTLALGITLKMRRIPGRNPVPLAPILKLVQLNYLNAGKLVRATIPP